MSTPLSALPLSPAYASALSRLGYTTLESLRGLVEAAPEVVERYLGTSITDLMAVMPSTSIDFAEETEWATLRNASLSTGAMVSATEVLTAEPFLPTELIGEIPAAAGAGPLPAPVNLISRMPPIRNQGSRGTCVAFAVAAAYEALSGGGAGALAPNLSEQFLYWNCKRNDGIPTLEGTWIRVAAALLHRDGICRETTLPYVPHKIPGNEGQGPVPHAALTEALGIRPMSVAALPAKSVPHLKHELLNGRCVPFSVPVFNSWFANTQVRLTGDIPLPVRGEMSSGGHAMCLVGYQDVSVAGTEWMGGGYFILRNSWGASLWGTHCRFGAGYGTIPYSYIAQFGSEAYSIS